MGVHHTYEQANPVRSIGVTFAWLDHWHCTKNWIYTNLLGANMMQKIAN